MRVDAEPLLRHVDGRGHVRQDPRRPARGGLRCCAPGREAAPAAHVQGRRCRVPGSRREAKPYRGEQPGVVEGPQGAALVGGALAPLEREAPGARAGRGRPPRTQPACRRRRQRSRPRRCSTTAPSTVARSTRSSSAEPSAGSARTSSSVGHMPSTGAPSRPRPRSTRARRDPRRPAARGRRPARARRTRWTTRRHVAVHERVGAYQRVLADRHPHGDDGVGPQVAAVADDGVGACSYGATPPLRAHRTDWCV